MKVDGGISSELEHTAQSAKDAEARMQAPAIDRGRIAAIVANVIITPAFILAAAMMARRNVRRGRGDRRGAARAAAFVLTVHMLAWIFGAHHVPDPRAAVDQFFGALAFHGLFQAALFWLIYLAVEPHVRRLWPHVLITWSRLVGGSIRDPLVGRDLLIGTAAGLALTVITLVYQYVPLAAGLPEFWPVVPDLSSMSHPRHAIASLFARTANAMQNGALAVLGLVLLRLLLRRTGLAFVAGSLIFGALAAQGQFESAYPLLDYAFGVLLCVILLLIALHYGMFATMAAFLAHFTTLGMALTLDSSRPYFTQGLMAFALLAALAAAGFYLARAGEPLFGKLLAED